MTRPELTQRLREAGIENAAGEARLLFAHVTGHSEAHLLAHPEESCTDLHLEALAEQRCKRIPLQYLLGEVVFYNETYRVSPGVLIPRSDTELLVEEAIRTLPPHGHFADLCTGSGCIAISVLAHRPDCTAEAFDISDTALALAAENARRNGVDDRLIVSRCDLLHHIPNGRYQALLSNPPYIPARVIPTLAPELAHEPTLALNGGEDGLVFYRRFFEHFFTLLSPGGFCLFEIGYDQEQALRRLAEEHRRTCRVLQDLGGNPRCICID